MSAAPAHGPGDPGELGCVLRVLDGVVVVLTGSGELRASYAAALLSRVAEDPATAPSPGEWWRLRRWPDGPVTVEHRLEQPLARVLPWRPRR